MATQMSGMFLTKHDEWQFNNWTKEQIYEAYLTEYKARMMLSKELNKLNRKLADIRHISALSNKEDK